MVISKLFFQFFSFILVLSSFMVVLNLHPIFSLFSLIISFLYSTFILFLLECEFLALIFLIVYVGAIVIGMNLNINFFL